MPTPSVVPHTDSIAPTESYTERYLSSSNPDRCLDAMLALIVGYALSRMLCTTAVGLRTVVCVSFFRLFYSYLVVSASDRRPPLLYTYTQHQILTLAKISSLSNEALPRQQAWIPLPRVPLVRISASSTACSFYTCSCDTIYLHREERDSAVYFCKPVGLGLGN